MAKDKKPKYNVGYSPTVNLLSNEHLAKRESVATRRKGTKFVIGVAVFTILLLAVPGSMAVLKSFELSGVETNVANLKLQQTQYKDVLEKQNAVSSLEAARIGIVTNEIDWAGFITGINSALGGDGSLSSMQFTQNPGDTAGAAAATTQPGVAAEDYVFTAQLDVNVLDGLTSIQQRFMGLEGAKSITFSTASGGGTGSYQVSATLVFTNDILWDRYAPTPEETAPVASPEVPEAGE